MPTIDFQGIVNDCGSDDGCVRRAATDIEEWIKEAVSLEDGVAALPREYHYSCLPLCLLDAVFSIGAKYASTKNVVQSYCNYVGKNCPEGALVKADEGRQSGNSDRKEPHTLLDLMKIFECFRDSSDGGLIRFDRFAEEVVNNRQRTSPNHGILKSEAVYSCAKILVDNHITTIADFRDAMKLKEKIEALEVEFTSVRGQGSGISFAYLRMLCGDEEGIKPDRHILQFLSGYRSEQESFEDCVAAVEYMTAITNELNCRRAASGQSRLTNREVDYIVWFHMTHRRCR